MALWTDLITPAELTGYVRAAMEDYEQRRGTLARWLPNRTVPDVVVRFVKGDTGLVPVAQFRAYDAEPAVGAPPQGKRITLELPALGQNIPASEYNQLRARGGNASDEQQLISIQATARRVAQAVSDAIERMRGIVLTTGVATIDQDNFQSADDFGRSTSHTITSGITLWDASSDVTILDNLSTWCDLYRDDNGEDPGAIVASTKVINTMAASDEFATQLANGGSRRATLADVQAILAGASLPPIYRYDRRVSVAGSATKVLDEKKLLILPPEVDPADEEGTQLGGTFWGRTLTSTEPGWGIDEADQPGVVAGVYRHEKPPLIAEVIGDAIGLPVLANADLSICATVLSS